MLAPASALPQVVGDAAMHVQAFVALSQTLPCTLAGAWQALVAHPDEARRLRDEPAGQPAAGVGLLRFAGPSRAVVREARADVTIGAAAIRAGDRVVLRLAAANRDPARFADPDRLDLDRGGAGHLALGRGTHSCWGAPVIRLAVAAATGALLRATRAIDADGAPTWFGGDAKRGPATLPVVLRRGLMGVGDR
jgi:cytochrome P450